MPIVVPTKYNDIMLSHGDEILIILISNFRMTVMKK